MDEPTCYDYAEPVNPSLECAICRTAFISPAMSPVCQHIFCHLCVARAIELSPTCPIDRSPLQLEDLIEAPRIIQAMVEELKVVCPNASRGCTVQCERGLLESHLRDECTSRPGGKGKGKAVADEAADEEAEKRAGWLKCELCQAKLREADLTSHSTSCPTASVLCPHCDATLVRSSLASHNLACPSIPVPCPHAHHGCSTRLPRSAMLEEHLEVTCPYEPIKDYLDRQEARLVEVESENKMLSTRCAGLEEGMKEMRSVLEGIRRGMGGFYIEVPADPEMVQDAPRCPDWPVSSPVAAATSPSIARSPLHADPHPHLSPRSAAAPLHDSHQPSTSPAEHFPFPPPLSPSVAAISPSQPLHTVLTSIQASIAALSSSVSSLEARQTASLMNESLRLGDDVQSVRAVVHGMRMQMHYLLMEVSRLTGGPGGGLRGGGGGGGGGHPSSSADSVESTSDDEQGHVGPSMMGMGMGMGGPGFFGQAPPPHQRYFLPGGGPPSMRGAGPLLYPMGGMKL